MFKCSQYKEKEDYIKGVSLIFARILKRYSLFPNQSFIKLFSEEISNRSYTGERIIYSKDIDLFKDYCISCASNLDKLFSSYIFTHILDKYNYKNKIKGEIGARLDQKNLNLYFSFKNANETQKDLDFFQFNNYIYNQINDISNDCLVMSVPTDSFYLIKYKKDDYTMRRGFITSIINNRIKKSGGHCLSCKNKCKPTFFNGLKRLVNII
jgi:hypothetical protein